MPQRQARGRHGARGDVRGDERRRCRPEVPAGDMSYEHVIYDKRGHVAYVTLNRPERMNALDADSHAELIEVFDDFEQDADAWLAIITGAGDRAFCAGN